MIKRTLTQFKKGTRVLNNNRYLVVQKLDDHRELREKLGSFIIVDGKRFYIVVSRNIAMSVPESMAITVPQEHATNFSKNSAKIKRVRGRFIPTQSQDTPTSPR